MFVYREKDRLFFRLNSLSALAYIIAVFLSSLLFSHPLILLALFLAVAAVLATSGLTKEWLNGMRYSSVLVLLILSVNAVFVRTGSTVLWRGPVLWGIGRIRVTLESLCFGLGMGLRLLLIISIFSLYIYAVNPDKVLKLFGRWNKKGGLALILSVRLFPLMVMDFQRVMEVQRCRGVRYEGLGWRKRIVGLFPVINIVLLSSLERSFQLAEAMQARGFGLGNRAYYNGELWRPRDHIIICAALLGIAASLLLLVSGKASYTYYPVLQPLGRGDLVNSVLLLLLYAVPAFLNWGWKNCLYLRARM